MALKFSSLDLRRWILYNFCAAVAAVQGLLILVASVPLRKVVTALTHLQSPGTPPITEWGNFTGLSGAAVGSSFHYEN